MRKLFLLLLVAALIAPQFGCSRRSQRYIGSGGLIGAAVGTGVGAAMSPGAVTILEGTAVGAGAGGLAGAIAADNFDDTDWDGMNARIAQLEAEKNELYEAGLAKDGLLAERDNMIAALQAEQSMEDGQIADLMSQLSDRDSTIALLQSENDRFSNDYVDMEARLLAQQEALDAKAAEMADLQDRLGSDISVGRQGDGITLTIVNDILYEAGQSTLAQDGEYVLAKAADIIRTEYPDHQLVIEGHTDDQPITRSSWASNWELGAARALSVLHYLEQVEAFPSDQMSAVSHGMQRPAVPNTTEAGRASNRRAVIVILPPDGEVTTAIKETAAAPTVDFAGPAPTLADASGQ